jgi:hypothetical protein
MIARAWAVIVGFLSVAGAGTDDLPAHILNLAREEHAIADELRHLPDYTCTETIVVRMARSKLSGAQRH